MKLTKVQITNFRSIEDSGEFDVHDLLCLVGKNEAGKSAIQQALGGLNPHPSTPLPYDIERDYPRRWLADYRERHPQEHATVVTTKWTLSEDEKTALTEAFGEGALNDKLITIIRRYGDNEPTWHIDLNDRQIINNLIAMEGLDEEEKQPLTAAVALDDVIDALTAIEEPSTRQARLLSRLTNFPNRSIEGAATNLFRLKLPLFLYSSHYDRMVSQIRLDTYLPRQRGQVQPPLEEGERVFVDFLEYAGTSIDEITTATTL